MDFIFTTNFLLATISLAFGNYILLTVKRPTDGNGKVTASDVVLWFLGVFMIHLAGGLCYTAWCEA